MIEATEKSYVAIDLKSFYASVECVDMGINPLDAYLVVADKSRTNKTICLAVTPALKNFGIGGRPRLFELERFVSTINAKRKHNLYQMCNKKDATGRRTALNTNFVKNCKFDSILKLHPEYKLDYFIAPPRMSKYIDVSTQIYNIYLKYVAPEDIHVYSIDEVFIDVTPYLKLYKCSPIELAQKMVNNVLETTGITATVGIGTNLYLAKIAMDIHAKHMPPDKNGARIAYLNEENYKKELWEHKPITDFWRIGPGYERRLAAYGMHTMGDVALCSHQNEDLLYDIFGINAELLIDHAWGWEPCTIAQVKDYKPVNNSLGTGQVLTKPYKYKEARLVMKEMSELLSLDLVRRDLLTNKIVIHIGYDISNLSQNKNDNIHNHNFSKKISSESVNGGLHSNKPYTGEITSDHYGRKVPKYAHSTINLDNYTSSVIDIMEAVNKRFEKVVNHDLLVRRINITACQVIIEKEFKKLDKNKPQRFKQLDIFTNYIDLKEQIRDEIEKKDSQKNLQKAIIDIKNKYGKNAILSGMSFLDGATMKERNAQIGGHKA